MARSTHTRRRAGIPGASWQGQFDIKLVAEQIAGPPAGMVRLQHREATTLAILMTPEAFGHGGAVWSTGAGIGSGSDPGWHIGISPERAWFSVEQSGGQKPARSTVAVVRDVPLGSPVCLVARHHNDRRIQISINGQHSDPVTIDGYGRLDCNTDSVIGGLVNFSSEYRVSGFYDRAAVWHQPMTDRQVGVLCSTWLQA